MNLDNGPFLTSSIRPPAQPASIKPDQAKPDDGWDQHRLIDARGATPLAQMWTALHMGDYVSFYLAMAYEVDPTPSDAVRQLKEELGL